MKKFFFIALALLYFAHGYSDVSLQVHLKIDSQGFGHVTEKIVVSLTDKTELEAFDYAVARGGSTLVDWSKFSPGGNVRYHLGRTVQPTNLRITAKRDYTIGYGIGVIILDYDLPLPVVNATRIGRVTRHELNPGILDFEYTKTEEAIIRKGASLTIEVPRGSVFSKISPEPTERKENKLTWNGNVVGRWGLIYDIEQPLSEEVNQFFTDLYANIISFIPVILLLVLAFFIAFKLLKK